MAVDNGIVVGAPCRTRIGYPRPRRLGAIRTRCLDQRLGSSRVHSAREQARPGGGGDLAGGRLRRSEHHGSGPNQST